MTTTIANPKPARASVALGLWKSMVDADASHWAGVR